MVAVGIDRVVATCCWLSVPVGEDGADDSWSSGESIGELRVDAYAQYEVCVAVSSGESSGGSVGYPEYSA